jgi:hypothetical protein
MTSYCSQGIPDSMTRCSPSRPVDMKSGFYLGQGYGAWTLPLEYLQGLKHGVGHMMGGNRGRVGKWRMLGLTLRVGFRWDGMEGMTCSTVRMSREKEGVVRLEWQHREIKCRRPNVVRKHLNMK